MNIHWRKAVPLFCLAAVLAQESAAAGSDWDQGVSASVVLKEALAADIPAVPVHFSYKELPAAASQDVPWPLDAAKSAFRTAMANAISDEQLVTKEGSPWRSVGMVSVGKDDGVYNPKGAGYGTVHFSCVDNPFDGNKRHRSVDFGSILTTYRLSGGSVSYELTKTSVRFEKSLSGNDGSVNFKQVTSVECALLDAKHLICKGSFRQEHPTRPFEGTVFVAFASSL